MAHHLSMDKVQAVLHLRSLGWSQRRIAENLGIDRKAVRRHLKRGGAKGTEAPPGEAPTGSEDSKGTKAPPGSGEAAAASGRSACEPFREQILAMLDAGLHGRRIFQDLVGEHGFSGKYPSVRRFVRRLRHGHPLPFRRVEVEPGQEAQVDFGMGAPYKDASGKTRKCYVLRVVLSHSRKGYSEAVPRQTTECFIRALENAFLYFGGVPRTLVIDNLRAAVTRADWFEPELNHKVVSFCEHYGTTVLPCRPRMPRHKGKVERGVDYVQENALRGRTFESLAAQNEALRHWESSVADTRIHGTTKRHVGKCFLEVEQAALAPLRNERFPCFEEGRRKVHRDGHVEIAGAYYSVPPEYVTRELWARWDLRAVRLFNHRWEQIAMHARVESGRFSTHAAHVASEKIASVERGTVFLLRKVGLIGPHSTRWAEAMLAHRGIAGVRVLQGLLGLTCKHTSDALENACDLAWRHQAYHLRIVRQLLERGGRRQETLAFLDEHPLIRPLSEYDRFVHQTIQQGG